MPNLKGLTSLRVTALYLWPKGTRFYGESDKMTRVTTRVTTTTPTVSQATIDGFQPAYRLFTARKQFGVLSDFSGYIGEFRMRKEAMYLADFTPPTAPFTI